MGVLAGWLNTAVVLMLAATNMSIWVVGVADVDWEDDAAFTKVKFPPIICRVARPEPWAEQEEEEAKFSRD